MRATYSFDFSGHDPLPESRTMLQNNLGNPRLRMAVRLALTGGSLAASFGVANAQTRRRPLPRADASLQEVVVTGSRIAVPNQVSISPVTFVSCARHPADRRDTRRGPSEPAAAGIRRPGLDIVNGADRHRDGRSARPRRQAHPGAGRRQSLGTRRSVRAAAAADINHDSGGTDRQRRSADRRRVLDLRRGRRRRRGELQAQRSF